MLRTLCAALALTLAACTPPAQAPQDEFALAETDARDAIAQVDAPQTGARITSPLTVTGTAPANWYFENQFPVRLLDAQGAEIAFAPATPHVNWTENAEPKQFEATLTFNVAQDTPATLVLQEDMPGEGVEPREVRIDVVLAAE